MMFGSWRPILFGALVAAALMLGSQRWRLRSAAGSVAYGWRLAASGGAYVRRPAVGGRLTGGGPVLFGNLSVLQVYWGS